MPTLKTTQPKKSLLLSILSLAIWGALVFVVIYPWIKETGRLEPQLAALALLNAVIWWLILLWTIHNLTLQIAALTKRVSETKDGANELLPSVAVLYVTCDDFSPRACRSCLNQDYSNFRVLICDDSANPNYRTQVEQFCQQHSSRCTLVTREDKVAFKAGNLNNAIKNHVQEDWVMLVDADQRLPINYLSALVKHIPNADHVIFVQAAQDSSSDGEPTHFQSVLGTEVPLFYSRDMSRRERYGFVPMFGHGALIRRAGWEMIGGFPQVVSEDFAFSLRAATRQLRGVYVESVVGEEEYPVDFAGFLIRLKKFAGGTAELCRLEVFSFFFGSATLVEKFDFGMQIFWYLMLPLVVLNGFLSGYVSYMLRQTGLPYIHPILPYLYTLLFLCVFAIIFSVSKGLLGSLQFYFWTTGIYVAASPVAGLSFIKHLFFSPSFKRTPKNGEKSRPKMLESVLVFLLGILATLFSVIWLSPFSPVLAAQGIAYLSFPLYGKLTDNSFLGMLARILIYVPGILMLFGIVAIWLWGSY